jgi:hypothetical protein
MSEDHHPQKSATPECYLSAWREIRTLLGPNREPLLIGIDGRDGAGKSNFASWLAWQFEMPSIHLDTFLESPESVSKGWRLKELQRVIKSRADKKQPIIVEGVLLLDALGKLGIEPDYLVYMECEKAGYICDESLYNDTVKPYLDRTQPEQKANLKVSWTPDDSPPNIDCDPL